MTPASAVEMNVSFLRGIGPSFCGGLSKQEKAESEGFFRRTGRARRIDRIVRVRRVAAWILAASVAAPALLALAVPGVDVDAVRCAIKCGHAVRAGAVCCPTDAARVVEDVPAGRLASPGLRFRRRRGPHAGNSGSPRRRDSSL